jgi:hypothetical protein
VRLWASAAHAHWIDLDFRQPTEAELAKRPVQFGPDSAGWLVLQLKEESLQAISLEHELAMFREAQKAESEQFRQHAQKMKLIATVVAFLFLICVIVGGFYWFQYIKNPDQFRNSGSMPGEEKPAVLSPATPAAIATNAPVPMPLPPPPAVTNQTNSGIKTD